MSAINDAPVPLSRQLADFLGAQGASPIAAPALEMAHLCLIDWMGVTLAGGATDEGERFRQALGPFARDGVAPLVGGGCAASDQAALLHGCLSHVLDFDDTDVPSILHASSVLWSALMAVGAERQACAADLFAAFVVGFEVGAAVGDALAGDGHETVGAGLTRKGWHATAALGRIAATTALARLLGLSGQAYLDALGLAMTAPAGLCASFGSSGKPLHAGQAARDSVLAVRLAQAGLRASAGVLDDPRHGWLGSLLQEGTGAIAFRFRTACDRGPWRISRNSFKPYASCQLTHAAIDAARAVLPGARAAVVAAVEVRVGGLAMRIAGHYDPGQEADSGKFSIAYCVALALLGHAAGAEDFGSRRWREPAVVDLARRVALIEDAAESRTTASIAVRLADGRVLRARQVAFGSEQRPMAADDVRRKFLGLCAPVLGDPGGAELLRRLLDFRGMRQVGALFAQGG